MADDTGLTRPAAPTRRRHSRTEIASERLRSFHVCVCGTATARPTARRAWTGSRVGRGRSASLPPRPTAGPGHARRLGHVLRRGPLRCDVANRANCATRWEGVKSGLFREVFRGLLATRAETEHNKQACARARDEKRKTPILLRLQHESAGVVTSASRRSWYAERQHNAGNFPCSGRFCRGCAIAHEVACGSAADASLSLRHGRAGNT